MEKVNVPSEDPAYEIYAGINGLLVHSNGSCAGEGCSIHHPSLHSMIGWPLNWRSDRRMMERLCKHGIGHPDPDDYWYRLRNLPVSLQSLAHGCDGCCLVVSYGKIKKEYDSSSPVDGLLDVLFP